MDSFIERIEKLAAKKGLERAKVYGESNDKLVKGSQKSIEQEEEKAHRRSNIAWLKDDIIKHQICDYVNQVNANTFNFSLHPYTAEIQYSEYDASYKGHFGWHVDYGVGDTILPCRKYSSTLQLSSYGEDYEGGEFELDGIKLPKEAYEKGALILFPSYLLHRVKPVTKGKRKTLVCFFHGPLWR
jgi:PKHD-type hydroxylase